MFWFNNHLGACSQCHGIGVTYKLDERLLFPDENLSISDGGIRYLKNIMFTDNLEWQLFSILCKHYNIDLFKPIKDLTPEERNIILHESTEQIFVIKQKCS